MTETVARSNQTSQSDSNLGEYAIEEDDCNSTSSTTSSASSILPDSKEITQMLLHYDAYRVIEETITRLYRLSTAIRRAGAYNRNLRAESYEEIEDIDGIEVNWTRQFFDFASRIIPSRIPNAAAFLQRRVATSISKRRNRFLYWREHQYSLEQSSRRAVQAFQDRHQADSAPPSSKETPHVTVAKSPQNPGQGRSVVTGTSASAPNLKAFRKHVASAKGSATTAGTFVWKSKDSFPQAPKVGQSETHFLCPFCFILCSAKEARWDRWTSVPPSTPRLNYMLN
jgi:ribosomal protein S18